MRIRPSRSLAVAAGTGLAAALLGGCTGSSGGSSSSTTTSPASSTASSSGASASPVASPKLEDASADEILARSRAELLAARSVHAKGVVQNAGTSYALDLRLVRGVGATGSLVSEGRSLGVLRIGKVAYVRLDAASWRAATGSDAAARMFAGKYLKVDASASTFKPILTLTDVRQTYGAALAPTGTVTKGPVTTLRGKRVIDLKINDGGSSGHVFVALDGKSYPMRLAYGRGSSQRVDFDSFGAKVTLTPPPASQVVAVPAR